LLPIHLAQSTINLYIKKVPLVIMELSALYRGLDSFLCRAKKWAKLGKLAQQTRFDAQIMILLILIP